jgi:hypothetical protein
MTEKQYFELVNLLNGLSNQISKLNTHPISPIWLNKTQVRIIFDYCDSSIRNIEPFLEVSRIGERKFYSTKSVLKFIESGFDNSQSSEQPNSQSL